ncbi:Hypothetical predicted protein [Olea europaea subsp. europaea]|uniref:Uncharacterized protein n=1 Tax=Olea europaea subsp. europaea TaxID=158383 RepID=A0A8S0QZK7_OLEEU|nr:Hypothetical predicted protein [Olea europaea subsp. europaea]
MFFAAHLLFSREILHSTLYRLTAFRFPAYVKLARMDAATFTPKMLERFLEQGGSNTSADFNPGRLQFYRYSEKAQHTLTLLLACSRPEQVHQEPVLSQLLGLLPRFSLPLLLVLKDLAKFLP